ncbi:unnamed protein product [Rotaria socialis]|uniref:Uncharacterized protein n=1 Tax=Rotaria socialis TaxID=392032 RepID=A0A818CDT1_9BILA|nr:unnamed protein product [Rotaria socialis]CAF4449545.1 unnamed protein product [Rotaria socialis]
MKFVVPISQCPIMMEFDGCTIARTLQDKWSQRIKLVLVADTNCAGRIHDLNDIPTDNTNWQDVNEIDSKSGLPQLHRGRDFRRKIDRPPTKIKQNNFWKI